VYINNANCVFVTNYYLIPRRCDVLMVDVVCVKTATISGVTHGSVVDPDTVISCTADVNAYPPAISIWTNHVDNSLSAGPQFVLQPGTQYKLTCTVSNNFNRCNAATVYVEFNSKLYVVFVARFHSLAID